MGAAACCGPRHRPPEDAFTEAAPLLAEAERRASSVERILAEARVEYYGSDGVRKGKVVVVAARPDAVRFEALSPTEDFLALLVSDGDRFVSFQRGDDRCFVGPACPLNVGRLLPLALPGAAVVHVLLGEAPVIAHDRAEVAFDTKTGRYDVTLEAPDRGERQRISFDTEDLAPREARVWRGDRLLFRVTWQEWKRRGGVRLPQKIRFRMPAGEVDLSIAYRDLDVNPADVGPETFRFAGPAGTTRWWLDCDGGPARPAPEDADGTEGGP